MRYQCTRPCVVRQRVIGGRAPLICLPLLAPGRSELLRLAQADLVCGPDLLEWRVDGFAALPNLSQVMGTLAELRAVIGSIPLIFTCRAAAEGGLSEFAPAYRLRLYQAATASGCIDMLDMELAAGFHAIASMREACREQQVKLILSYHNFKTTPAATIILEQLQQACDWGADLAKVAVMPHRPEDVLTLLQATCRARRVIPIPMITMAMGDLGKITRLAGALFGSDVTFAAGGATSAPGQMAMEDIKTTWALLALNEK